MDRFQACKLRTMREGVGLLRNLLIMWGSAGVAVLCKRGWCLIFLQPCA